MPRPASSSRSSAMQNDDDASKIAHDDVGTTVPRPGARGSGCDRLGYLVVRDRARRSTGATRAVLVEPGAAPARAADAVLVDRASRHEPARAGARGSPMDRGQPRRPARRHGRDAACSSASAIPPTARRSTLRLARWPGSGAGARVGRDRGGRGRVFGVRRGQRARIDRPRCACPRGLEPRRGSPPGVLEPGAPAPGLDSPPWPSPPGPSPSSAAPPRPRRASSPRSTPPRRTARCCDRRRAGGPHRRDPRGQRARSRGRARVRALRRADGPARARRAPRGRDGAGRARDRRAARPGRRGDRRLAVRRTGSRCARCACRSASSPSSTRRGRT